MALSNWRIGIALTTLAPCLIGCQSQGPPRDPLFLSKPPVAAKAELAPPITFASLEPSMPQGLFEEKNAPAYADKSAGSVPGTLTNRKSADK